MAGIGSPSLIVEGSNSINPTLKPSHANAATSRPSILERENLETFLEKPIKSISKNGN